MTAVNIRSNAEILKYGYLIDLGTSFSNECIHFGNYLKTITNPPRNVNIYKKK